MSSQSAWKILPAALAAAVCLGNASAAPAQQAGGANTSGIYSPSISVQAPPVSGATGFNPSGTRVPSGIYTAGLAGLPGANSAGANSAGAKLKARADEKSAWQAGSSSMRVSNAASWTAGASSFGASGASSWIAGADEFGVERQAGGIWRASPGSGSASGSASQASVLPSPPAPVAPLGAFSAGLTHKGSALVKHRGLTSKFASRLGAGSGVPFGGSFGMQTKHTPASGTTDGGRSIDQMLNLNDNIDSGKPSGSDGGDSSGGGLH